MFIDNAIRYPPSVDQNPAESGVRAKGVERCYKQRLKVKG